MRYDLANSSCMCQGFVISKHDERNHRTTCPFEVGGMRDIDAWKAMCRFLENPIDLLRALFSKSHEIVADMYEIGRLLELKWPVAYLISSSSNAVKCR